MPHPVPSSADQVAPLVTTLLRGHGARLGDMSLDILADVLMRLEKAFGIDLDADEALAAVTPLGLITLVQAKVRALETPAPGVASLCAYRAFLGREPARPAARGRVIRNFGPDGFEAAVSLAKTLAGEGDDSPADAPAPTPKPAPVPAYASVSSFAAPPAIPRRDPTSGARVESTPGGGFAVYGLFDPMVWPRPHAKWVRHESADGVFGRPLPASLGPAFPTPPPRPVLTAATPTGGWVATPQEPPESAHAVRDPLALPRHLAKAALLALAAVILIWGRVDDDTARRAEGPAAAALRGALS